MSKELTISQKQIEDRIFTIRGVQVMIDRDLAEMYQVETQVLNQAVKRNIDRFPEDFMFQLSQKEWEDLNLKSENFISSLRSQNVILENGRGKHREYLPFVFTEQGVAGLSGVLKSETATKVHVAIMRSFIAMRKTQQQNLLVYERIDRIERKQLETDQKFEQVFKALESKHVIPAQGVFFNGQVFDAYELASKIIRSAKERIILIDK